MSAPSEDRTREAELAEFDALLMLHLPSNAAVGASVMHRRLVGVEVGMDAVPTEAQKEAITQGMRRLVVAGVAWEHPRDRTWRRAR